MRSDAPGMKWLLSPRTIAVFGDAAEAVRAANEAVGFTGEVWQICPGRPSSSLQGWFRSVDELPSTPDASFINVPAEEVPAIAASLRRMGAGGFIGHAPKCAHLTADYAHRQPLEPTGGSRETSFLGPSSSGFVNFFDRAAVWSGRVPRRHVNRGVAIVCQHGSVADRLLFNDRSLPLGYFICVGAELRLSVAEMIDHLVMDERVSAFGLYLQDSSDLAHFAGAIETARSAGKPVALIYTGRIHTVRIADHAHSSRLCPPIGTDEVFDSFCRQSGIARCRSLASFCETLKVFHTGGPLPGARVLLAGASGGAMAMTVDAARDSELQFPPLPANYAAELRDLLTDKVAIANPLDFHSHNWFDSASMLAMFSCLHRSGFDATAFVIDCPPMDRADATTYLNVIDQYIAAYPGPPGRAVILSSLPESLPTSIREKCLAAGITPLQGQREGLEALDLARQVGEEWQNGSCVTLRIPTRPLWAMATATERSGESSLAELGIAGPRSHPASAKGAAEKAQGNGLLPEEVVADCVAELFIRITIDRQFGQVLAVGSSGALRELLPEQVLLLPPFTRRSVEAAFERLEVWKLLMGLRGRPAGDVAAIIDVVLACTRFAQSRVDSLIDLKINPLVVRPAGKGVIAVDSRIRTIEQVPQ